MASLMEEIMKDYLVGKKPMIGSEWTPEQAAAQAQRSQRALDRSAAVTEAVAGLGAGTVGVPAAIRGLGNIFARSAPSANAMLVEPAVGAAAQNAISRGSMMNAPTSAATMMTASGLYPNFLPRRAEGDTGASTPLMPKIPDEVGLQYRPSMAPALAPRMPDEVGMQYRPSMNPALAPRMPDEVGFQYRPSANPLANPALNQPVVAGLDTANRPAPMASSVTAPARPQGFFEQLFKGQDFQSNNLPVNAMPQGHMPGTGATMPSYINYGDPNNAADFFRADALLQQQNPGFFGLLGGGNG